MKRRLASLVAGVGVTSAFAADLKLGPATPDPWEIAYGATLMSDYNVRGITQSARRPAAGAYFESRYNVNPSLQLYGGLFGNSIDFPNDAASQIGLYGGIKPTFDKLSVDLGAWYLFYPGGMTFDGLGGPSSCTTRNIALCNTIKGNLGFWEAYAKPSYAINAVWTLGAITYYSPSVLNSGAWGTYAAATAKLTVPSSVLPKEIGASISGELGRYWFGTTDAFYGVPAFPAGVKLPDYNTWNVGLTLTYKVLSLDLRYYDTDLTKANCNVLTDDQTATFGGPSAITAINPTGLVSNWCGAAFIGKLSFDTTIPSFK